MNDDHRRISRRDLLKAGSCGFGYLALASLATEAAAAESFRNPLAPRMPHFAPKAKRVIFLFMQGGPSHLETFDYKPELAKSDGKDLDVEYFGRRVRGKLLAPRYSFARHGASGLPISEVYPHLARHADDLCLLNGMHTDNPAHPQATILMHTGSAAFVRPSMGSWVVYGLGTENDSLPGFVTIDPPGGVGGAQNYGSSFLPASYQGTRIDGTASRIPDIANRNVSRPEQRRQLDLIQAMNRDLLARAEVNTELEGVIESFELAFRMQTAVPGVLDISKETEATRALYGIDKRPSARFGTQCLMARRLAEAGVRFIEISHRGWDQHNNLKQRIGANCLATDQPIAGLIRDLKQRGLFEDTLIVWGGEFGRSAIAQNADGRRHNNRGFSMWMAGGGVKGGIRHGATDPTGSVSVENKVHVHDLHATILHLLGLDHEKLTYRYSGRDFRLTDVYGNVVREVIA